MDEPRLGLFISLSRLQYESLVCLLCASILVVPTSCIAPLGFFKPVPSCWTTRLEVWWITMSKVGVAVWYPNTQLTGAWSMTIPLVIQKCKDTASWSRAQVMLAARLDVVHKNVGITLPWGEQPTCIFRLFPRCNGERTGHHLA